VEIKWQNEKEATLSLREDLTPETIQITSSSKSEKPKE